MRRAAVCAAVMGVGLRLLGLGVHMQAQQASRQDDLMKQARGMAEKGQEFIMNLAVQSGGAAEGKSGVFAFYNNPRPFCYTYAIPGEWVISQAESAWRSKDGRECRFSKPRDPSRLIFSKPFPPRD